MKTIIRNRDSGKSKELLEYAQAHNAAILTQNKRAFKVKADSLGFNNVTILDYQNLENDDYEWYKDIVVHNGDKVLKELINKYYSLNVIGFTATEGE